MISIIFSKEWKKREDWQIKIKKRFKNYKNKTNIYRKSMKIKSELIRKIAKFILLIKIYH